MREVIGMKQNSRVLGVTGGIGAGKSTILAILSNDYGYRIIETDKLAHQLMEPGHQCYDSIVEKFGHDIISNDNKIDRPKLANIVFSNPDELKSLNNIVHPAVKKYILDIIEDNRDNSEFKLVIEAALLIEDGYKNICDEIWYIYCNDEERINRLMKSRGYTYDKCISIMNNQSNDKYYRNNTDFVIDNSFTSDNTRKQIKNRLI